MDAGDDQLSDQVGTNAPRKITLHDFLFIKTTMEQLFPKGFNCGGPKSPAVLSLRMEEDSSSSCSYEDEETDGRLEPLVFDVEEEGSQGTERWTSYEQFTMRMRWRFLAYKDHFELFDAILRIKSHEVAVKFCGFKFYVVGYRMGKANQWLEFGHDKSYPPGVQGDKLRIRGSSYLEIDDEYESLLNEMGRGQKLSSINIGRRDLASAINVLATSENVQERARSLIVARMMICEGLRLRFVRDFVSETSRESMAPPPWLETLILQHEPCAQTTMESCGYNDIVKVKAIPKKAYPQGSEQNGGLTECPSGLTEIRNFHMVNEKNGVSITEPEADDDVHAKVVGFLQQYFDVKNSDVTREAIVLKLKHKDYPKIVKEAIDLAINKMWMETVL